MNRILLLVLLAIVIAPPALLLVLSSTPAISIAPGTPVIGANAPISVRIGDSHGLRRVTATLEQGGQRYPIFETSAPAHRLWFFRGEPNREFPVSLSAKLAPKATDGPATLEVEAVSNDLRGSASLVRRDVRVVTQPPVLVPDGILHYINQGGSEMVSFSVGGYAADSGVLVGNDRFRSFPIAGTQRRFSLFAFSWDAPIKSAPLIFASNPAGQVTAEFHHKIFPKKFRKRDLKIDDAFLQKVVTQIDPNGTGDLLTRFLKLNRETRIQNNQTLAALRENSEPRFLWSGPFLQLANSEVESSFADVRTYIYNGKKIDQEVHLGFDFAKVKNTPIPAANDGRVVFAENLGIYGNCIVIDHGYTLQSIYGHLSRIQVKPGDMVKKGQTIGLSGSTGLAGGDHLHYSMQVGGVQVNPVEWWDAHWIHDHILGKAEGK